MKFATIYSNPKKFAVGNVGSYWETISDDPWIRKIIREYYLLNNHISFNTFRTHYGSVLATILSSTYVDSSGTGYYYNTFGVNGQNKQVADFLIMFLHDGNTLAKSISKTGNTLRHNIGGDIYNQNNVPAHVYNGNTYYIISSTDGFAGVTQLFIDSCHLTNEWPSIRYFTGGITTLRFMGNNLETDFTNYIWPVPVPLEIEHYTNVLIRGDMTDVFIGDCRQMLMQGASALQSGIGYISAPPKGLWTNGKLINLYVHNQQLIKLNITTACNLTAFSQINAENSFLSGSEIDNLFLCMNTWYTANLPTKNVTVNVAGLYSGYLTGGAANPNLINIQARFALAGKVFTAIYGTIPAKVFSSSAISIGFDDGFDDTYTIAVPVFESYGKKLISYFSSYYIDTYVGYEYMLTWPEIKDMILRGHDLESHSYDHSDFTLLTVPQMIANFTADQASWVAQGLAVAPHLAWPVGKNNAASRAVAAGYFKSARAASGGYFYEDADKYAIPAESHDDTQDHCNLLKRKIDVAIDKKACLHIYYHETYDDSTPPLAPPTAVHINYIKQIIEYCITKGLPILTRCEMYNNKLLIRPNNLALALIPGGVRVTWTDVETDYTKVEIWRSDDLGLTYNKITEVNPGIGIYDDMSVGTGTYKIRTARGLYYSEFTVSQSI